MATFIKTSIRLGRNHFGTFVELPDIGIPVIDQYYNHYFDRSKITRGTLPTGRGCRICGKIGHKIKECELRRPNRGRMGDRRGGGNQRPAQRGACNICRSMNHQMRDCPENPRRPGYGQSPQYYQGNSYHQRRGNMHGQVEQPGYSRVIGSGQNFGRSPPGFRPQMSPQQGHGGYPRQQQYGRSPGQQYEQGGGFNATPNRQQNVPFPSRQGGFQRDGTEFANPGPRAPGQQSFPPLGQQSPARDPNAARRPRRGPGRGQPSNF